MITSNPYGIGHIIKPGHLPEPLQPVNQRDPQSAVDRCLACKIPKEKCFGTCGPYSDAKENDRAAGAYDYEAKRSRYQDLDEKVDAMVKAGYNNYPICRALGITEKQLKMSKKRLQYWHKKWGETE